MCIMYDVGTRLTGGSLLGHAVKRREDPALLRGERSYIGDLEREGLLHAMFVRSPLAFADVLGIDVTLLPEGAMSLTYDDIPITMTPAPVLDQRFARPVLADGVVRYVGEPVVVVVAAGEREAADAASLVVLDYEPRRPVTDPLAALREDAPLLFPEAGSNRPFHRRLDCEDDPLELADVVVSQDFVQQRLAPVPMEPGAILAEPDGEGGLVVAMGTQDPSRARATIADALGLPRDRVRVVVPAMGGGFGAKGPTYPEHIVVAELARRLGRPVRWLERRTENLVNMVHGRAQFQSASLGATRDGRIVGLRAHLVNDAGAYPTIAASFGNYAIQMSSGVYDIPRIDITAEAAVTNLTPTGAYRGAGRPEAAQMLERLVDLLAVDLDMDPVELRRKNLIEPFRTPRAVASGATYDSGNYRAALDLALEQAGWAGLLAERDERRVSGDPLQLGVAVACYVETTIGILPPREFGAVSVEADGTITAKIGGSSHGQGHVTTISQIVAGTFEVPIEHVMVVQSDTAAVPEGVAGTFASRTLQLVGSSIVTASATVIDSARLVASEALEAAPGDLVVRDGGIGVAGVPDAHLAWSDLRRIAGDAGVLLEADSLYSVDGNTYPFGAHVAVVELDAETGWVRLVRHVAVDDCGTVINPMLARGQQHGGVAQGAGQALFESIRYDEDGNPLTGNLTTYLIPTAVDLPAFEVGGTVTPSPLNPLGAKGIGEAGTLGSTPAIHGAVLDALRPHGVRHVDLPLTPARVWDAMQAARRHA
jgi:aerobic carbon-monoxide dehydrogenase large subunit